MTKRGTLYVVMAKADTAAALPSGVCRLCDVTTSTIWKWVGDTTPIPPNDETLAEIGDRASLVFLSVVDGSRAEADLLHLACPFSNNNFTFDEGLFRGHQRFVQRNNTCTWKYKIYGDYRGYWFTDNWGEEWEFDPGWMDYDGAISFRPIVSDFHSDRVALQMGGRMHVSADSADWWDQRYTVASGSFWESRGYNEIAVSSLSRAEGAPFYMYPGGSPLLCT